MTKRRVWRHLGDGGVGLVTVVVVVVACDELSFVVVIIV